MNETEFEESVIDSSVNQMIDQEIVRIQNHINNE